MAFIRIIEESEAEGALAREHEIARKRSGRVYNVLKIQGARPHVLRASVRLYLEIMYGESALSRAEREMVAVVVSQVNSCHY